MAAPFLKWSYREFQYPANIKPLETAVNPYFYGEMPLLAMCCLPAQIRVGFCQNPAKTAVATVRPQVCFKRFSREMESSHERALTAILGNILRNL